MHELLIDTYFAIDKGQKGSCKKGQKGRQEAIFFYLAFTIFVVVGQRGPEHKNLIQGEINIKSYEDKDDSFRFSLFIFDHIYGDDFCQLLSSYYGLMYVV